MTTAARPTFDTARGGSGVREKSLGKLSQQVSSRDLPAHLKLKTRTPGQDTIDEVNERDLKAELEDRERIAQLEKSKNYTFVPSLEQANQIKLALREARDKAGLADDDQNKDTDSLDNESRIGPALVDARKIAQLDADEDFDSVDMSESDFEDDPEDLMAELERIRSERAAEKTEQNKEVKEKEESVRSQIDDDAASFTIKRRWDDDVPFKNCARGEPDPKRKLYVNDTLRQEFHRKFMDKYIR